MDCQWDCLYRVDLSISFCGMTRSIGLLVFFCPIEFKVFASGRSELLAAHCQIMPPHGGLPSKAPCIKPKWADLILKGVKSVELRSTMTHIRGVIAIAHSGHLYGEVAIIDCFAVSDEWLHSVEDLQILPAYKTVYAWVLKGHHRYDRPLRYKHPRGQWFGSILQRLAHKSRLRKRPASCPCKSWEQTKVERQVEHIININ